MTARDWEAALRGDPLYKMLARFAEKQRLQSQCGAKTRGSVQGATSDTLEGSLPDSRGIIDRTQNGRGQITHRGGAA